MLLGALLQAQSSTLVCSATSKASPDPRAILCRASSRQQLASESQMLGRGLKIFSASPGVLDHFSFHPTFPLKHRTA